MKTDEQKLEEVEDRLDGCFEDFGVRYPRGKPLVRIRAGTPKRGQYLFNPHNGVYRFSNSDTKRYGYGQPYSLIFGYRIK